MKKKLIPFLIFMFLLSTQLVFQAKGQGKPLTYSDNKEVLVGYLAKAKSDSKKIPGVVIIPAWMGVDDHAKNSANKLSALGYHALVADIYGEGNNPKTGGEAAERSTYYKTHAAAYQHRIQLAIDQLIKQGADPAHIAVVGYCFGGTGAIEAARGGLPVKGIVSFHGGLTKDTSHVYPKSIAARMLILHGADDPYVSPMQVTAFQQEMRDANVDWEMIYYANAVHAFSDPNAGTDNSKGAAYNELAAMRSWEHMKLFLSELFK
jgi:dienelactone hydrolase